MKLVGWICRRCRRPAALPVGRPAGAEDQGVCVACAAAALERARRVGHPLCALCRERRGKARVGDFQRVWLCLICVPKVRGKVRRYFDGPGHVRWLVMGERLSGLEALRIARGEMR